MTTNVCARITTNASSVDNPQEQINDEVEDSNCSRASSRKSWYSSFTANTVRRSNVSDEERRRVNKKTNAGDKEHKRRTSSKLRIKRNSMKDGITKSSQKLNNMKAEEEEQQLMSTLSTGPSFYCDLATVAEDDLSQICHTIESGDDCRTPQEESEEDEEYAGEVTSPTYERFLQHVGGGDRGVDSITS